MKIALIQNSIVQNIIVGDSLEYVQALFSDMICLDTAVTACSIGWTYDLETQTCLPPPKPDVPQDDTTKMMKAVERGLTT